jgi:hypothetical protein
MLFAGKGMELKIFMLSKVSQAQEFKEYLQLYYKQIKSSSHIFPSNHIS